MYYKNYICKKLGRIEDITLEKNKPQKLKKNQVRLKIMAIGLSYVDTLMIKGTYQHKNKLPFVPGTEACGIITEQNCNNKNLLNKKAIINTKKGCFSEEIVVNLNEITIVRKSFSITHGATFLTSSLTSYIALKELARVKKKEILLITGASGAIGQASIKLALHFGLEVICVSSNNAKLEVLRNIGVNKLINKKEDIYKRVMLYTKNKGVNIILDINGFLKEQNLLKCLSWNGKYLIVGFTNGNITAIKTNYILIKGIQVIGVRAGEYLRQLKTSRRKALIKNIFKLFDSGIFKIKEYKIKSFNKLTEALACIRDGRSIGKIIIKTKYFNKYSND